MSRVKRTLAPMQYVSNLYDRTPRPLTFGATTEAEWKAWRRKLKAKFAECLGGLDDPPCDLEPEVLSREQMPGYVREKVVFQSFADASVPAWVLIPDGLTRPAGTVICLAGHGRGKDEIVGIADDGSQRTEPGEYQNDFAIQAVKRGFFTIAPEVFGFGERRDAREIAQGAGHSSCQQPAMSLMMLGRTLPGLRTYDTMRTVDYLLTRPECDPKRIGCMGISGGGLVTLFAAAMDERIAACLVSGYMNFWRDCIIALYHCTDNYVPEILKWAEEPDIGCLVAPRPMFIESGTVDPIFPVKATRRAHKAVREAYKLLGCEDRLGCEIFEGDHFFCGNKGFPFLEKWLLP